MDLGLTLMLGWVLWGQVTTSQCPDVQPRLVPTRERWYRGTDRDTEAECVALQDQWQTWTDDHQAQMEHEQRVRSIPPFLCQTIRYVCLPAEVIPAPQTKEE
jgi:hypothetical protein